MITVRYPSGVAITYNRARFLTRGPSGWNLYTKEEGEWICSIQESAGVIVEAQAPCRIENPAVDLPESRAEEMVAAMYEEGRHTSGDQAARVKRALRAFNMQTWKWKT